MEGAGPHGALNCQQCSRPILGEWAWLEGKISWEVLQPERKEEGWGCEEEQGNPG